jgi:predicted ATPase/class 3 adenylate cyclase
MAAALCVLGSLEVVRDGEQVRLGSPQQRRLLAMLVVHANEVVSSDRLVDLLWGDDPPASATHTLQTLLSRLRATLGDDRLETCPPGYRLRVASDEVDALRFEELVRVGLGSSDRPERAVGMFDEALELWRGSPYAEFASEEFATAEVARLFELRARAIEERSAALLELGRPEEVIGELEAEITLQPFRERLRALLMLALARAGRPVESLRVYDAFRRFLADEVGVVPSLGLQELNDDIVRQHPDVGWAGSPTTAGTADLPSGTVTFLFTDVEGSTRLWEESPDGMREAMALHDELLHDAVTSHGGFIVKATGDGFHAVFATAHDAVMAAVAAQRALRADSWNIAETVRVRMGIHTGEAEVRDGDYSGSAVNRAARLMSVAHGGQIVVSLATEELLRDGAPENCGIVDLGEHRLRDLGRPERLFQVVHPHLDRKFGPLRSLDAFPGNLPLQASSFVGRDVELVRVADALEGSRVVTLTGVGGVGKTRLALQVAGEVLLRFRHGAWLAELAPVRDPNVVVDAVAGVFGVTPRPGVDLMEMLTNFLRPKELLLVLDNCEHLLGSVVDLVRTLDAKCPRLLVLATSREGLGIAGERIVAVPSLALPGSDARDAVLSSDAGRLFVDRAVAVKSDFAVTDANAGAIAEVARRLDGIPLALELAAARIPVLSPAQLAQRLDQRFRVLAGGERGAIERHATLRAAIDWSYDLLATGEQRVLARLSVFAGGCSLEAAEAVCAGGGIDEVEVLDVLSALVARSLVVADDAASSERRYRLLETIRQYADERIDGAERTELRDRHAGFYADFAETAAQGLRGPDQLRWLLQVESELENLRAAMAWSVASNDAVRAARFLCSALGGVPSTLAGVLLSDAEAVLDLPSIDTIARYPLALAAAGNAAYFHGRLDRAEQLCQEALDAASVPSDELAAFTFVLRGRVAYSHGDANRAVEYLERAVSSSRRVGDLPMLVSCLDGLAAWRTNSGDAAGAADAGREALALARQTGNPGLTSQALGALARALVRPDPEQSRTLIAESLELNDALGDIVVDENALVMVVMASAELGERDHVLRLSARALHHRLSLLVAVCACLEATAEAVAHNEPDTAAVLHGAIDSLVPGLAQADPQSTLRERATAAIHPGLDAARMSELRAQGAAMTEDQATEYALDAIARKLSDEHP